MKKAFLLFAFVVFAWGGDYFLGGGVGMQKPGRQLAGKMEESFSSPSFSLLAGWNSATAMNTSYGQCTGLACSFERAAVRFYASYDYNPKSIQTIGINGDFIVSEVLFFGFGYNFLHYGKQFSQTEKAQTSDYWAFQVGLGNIGAKHGFEVFYKLPLAGVSVFGFENEQVKLRPGYSFGLRYIYNFKD